MGLPSLVKNIAELRKVIKMPGKRFVFVLRLWAEEDQLDAMPEHDWRGSLHMVEDEQVYYFVSINRLGDILRGLIRQQQEKTNPDF